MELSLWALLIVACFMILIGCWLSLCYFEVGFIPGSVRKKSIEWVGIALAGLGFMGALILWSRGRAKDAPSPTDPDALRRDLNRATVPDVVTQGPTKEENAARRERAKELDGQHADVETQTDSLGNVSDSDAPGIDFFAALNESGATPDDAE